jgi:hypothetical protein
MLSSLSIYDLISFFALCNKYAYLDKKEFKSKVYNFKFPPFEIETFEIETLNIYDSRIYILLNNSDFVIICKGIQQITYNDIKIEPSQIGIGYVNSYFKEILNIALPYIMYKISKLNSNISIWCSGHEFGGSIANAISYHLDQNNIIQNGLFTYSMCMVGDELYKTEIKNIKCNHYNFSPYSVKVDSSIHLSNSLHKINTIDKINRLIKNDSIKSNDNYNINCFNFMKKIRSKGTLNVDTLPSQSSSLVKVHVGGQGAVDHVGGLVHIRLFTIFSSCS